MRKSLFAVFGLLFMVMSLTSCIRPYDKPEYVEVDPNETAFVIPLFTDNKTKTEDQVQLNADKAFYEQCMVSSKLIQVPHKWIQTGRLANTGYYTGTVKVITVDLTPHAGRWLPGEKEAIKVETAASQGITIPMSYTMHIESSDAALYLSNYRATDFDSVINVQVNRYFAGVAGEEFHKVEYKDVAKKRDEILKLAVDKTTSHFKEQGITIDAMAIIDGLIYDDKSLQDNIDQQAKAQAQKVLEDEKKELLVKQRENTLYEAETRRQEMEKQRTTMNLEQDKLDREQARKNTAVIAEAQAEAIKNGKYAPVPQTMVIQDLKSLGSWNPDFMKQ